MYQGGSRARASDFLTYIYILYFLIRNREKFVAGGSLTLGISFLVVLIRNCKKNRGGTFESRRRHRLILLDNLPGQTP
jgi:hypothetical protein